MYENQDSSRSVDAGEIAGSIAWLATRFPQVAVSQGPERSGEFLTVNTAWHCEGGMIGRLLDYQNRFAAGMDDRVRGAHLVSFYSHHLSIAAAALHLRAGLVPDLHADCLGLRFEPIVAHDCVSAEEGGQPDAFRLHFRFGKFARGEDWAALFQDGFVESFTPMIEALQVRTGLSPAAQWRLAADGIAGAFLDVGRALGEEERAMAAALAIIGRSGSPLFTDTLRYQRISAVCQGVAAERVFRLRSGCCLYYRTVGGDYCDVCVLLDEETRKSRLRAHVERTGGL